MELNEKYEAGLCNIGQQEIVIRKKLFNFSFLVTLVITCFSLSLYDQSWMMLLLFSSVFFTVLLYFEIRLKFCIVFGLFNLYNFSNPGHLENVNNGEHKQKDKLKAFKIVSLTSLVAATITFLEYLMVGYLHV